MKLYIVSYWGTGTNIRPVEVVSQTPKSFLTKSGARRMKSAEGLRVFETHKEAKSFLVGELEKRIASMKAGLEYQKQKLKDLKEQAE